MGKKVVAYLKGLALTFLATVLFAAIGWIQIGASFPGSNIVVPLAIAAAIWTVIFIAFDIVWGFIFMVTGCTLGLGIFLALPAVGYCALKLAQFLLPGGWFGFVDDPLLYFAVGSVYALISLVVQPGGVKVSVSTTKKGDREK